MLMVNCSQFWNAREGNGAFAPTWRHINYREDEPQIARRSRSAHFHLLRMLEYDNALNPHNKSKYCCRGCLTAHAREEFSLEELARNVDLKSCDLDKAQDNTFHNTIGRYCLTTKKCFRYGLCQELSFVELKDILAAHKQETQQWDIPLMLLPYDQDLTASSTVTFKLILAHIRDIDLHGGAAQLLQAVNFPLCPHVRLRRPTKSD